MATLDELHKQVTGLINDERHKEMADFIARKRAAREAAAKKEAQAMDQLKAMKLDVDKFTTFHRGLAANDANELARIKEKYKTEASEPKRIAPEFFREIGSHAAITPADARILPPSFAAVFSTKDDQEKLSGGTGTDVYNYNIIDVWDWASGAGNGWFGSGAGEYQVWAEWGYWFLPTISKYYSILPHDVFRGYYIVMANTGFWNSNYAKAVVSTGTDVWASTGGPYRWKYLNRSDELDVEGNNINVNQRFDTDRHTYNSMFLNGGDWAFIRNFVGLYVYAQGGGAYAELNFAVGPDNYLSAPHVHVY